MCCVCHSPRRSEGRYRKKTKSSPQVNHIAHLFAALRTAEGRHRNTTKDIQSAQEGRVSRRCREMTIGAPLLPANSPILQHSNRACNTPTTHLSVDPTSDALHFQSAQLTNTLLHASYLLHLQPASTIIHYQIIHHPSMYPSLIVIGRSSTHSQLLALSHSETAAPNEAHTTAIEAANATAPWHHCPFAQPRHTGAI